MLVPAVASGAAGELDGVRAACFEALREVLATAPERVVVVGAGTSSQRHGAGTGSLRGFGVALDVPLDPAVASPTPLPLSLTIGAWLLAAVGWPGDRVALELDASAGAATLAAIGTALGQETVRTVLLVVADGSASRTERAPASLDPDAQAFDADVEAALASGHPHVLAEVDGDRAAAVTSHGWPAWHVAATATAVAGDAPYEARVLAAEGPYGVGYLVASWTAT